MYEIYCDGVGAWSRPHDRAAYYGQTAVANDPEIGGIVGNELFFGLGVLGRAWRLSPHTPPFHAYSPGLISQVLAAPSLGFRV